MSDDLINLDLTGAEFQFLGHCPLNPFLRIDLVNLSLIKIQTIGILKEYCKSAVIKTTH